MKKERSVSSREITIPVSLVKDICDYCESKAVYDKFADYGDFYYKPKKLIGD